MTDFDLGAKGYLYVLSVKDIDLPVCKIGMTSRDPAARCAEINKSSTGDFIWEVVHHLSVNDCRKLESLVHQKLAPLRQKRREFFNLYPDDAVRAIKSIIDAQSEIIEIASGELEISPCGEDQEIVTRPRDSSRRSEAAEFAQLMDSFTEFLAIKGRPFGQLNRPIFGISDGKEGVQWNLAIYPEDRLARIGVNLEGMQYIGWPIAKFILAELESSTIQELTAKLVDPGSIIVRFVRDAWQVSSRPIIREEHLAGREIPISEMDVATWNATLIQALGCLNKERNYRGRGRQEVTILKKSGSSESKRDMEVSPHLNIWTAVSLDESPIAHLPSAIERLTRVHEWVSRRARG